MARRRNRLRTRPKDFCGRPARGPNELGGQGVDSWIDSRRGRRSHGPSPRP
nr:A295 [uncultured bacterium]